MIKTIFGLAVLVAAGSAFAAPASAGCIPYAGVESTGQWNEADVDLSRCGQAGIYQNGIGNKAAVGVHGRSGVVLGQRGIGGRAEVWVEGDDHDHGADLTNGATLDLQARGRDIDSAVYAEGGDVTLRAEGIGHRIRINQR